MSPRTKVSNHPTPPSHARSCCPPKCARRLPASVQLSVSLSFKKKLTKPLSCFFAPSDLRDQLLAQVHSPQTQQQQHQPQQQHLHHHDMMHQHSSSASPHDHNSNANIDPAISGSNMANTSAGESGGDDNGADGRRGGKRELSTSKRAAQNRAAQVCLMRFLFCVPICESCFSNGVRGKMVVSIREVEVEVYPTFFRSHP